MKTLYEDRLIRQARNKSGEVYTIRKRLSKNVPYYFRDIQTWAKEHNGNSIKIIKAMRNKYKTPVKTTLMMFKVACGIRDLSERHQENYHKIQQIRINK